MKSLLFRPLVAPVCLVVMLALGGCASTKNKSGAGSDSEKKDETPKSEETATESTPADKPNEEKKKEAADPLTAAEFQGLAKGEAEFLLACRTAGTGEKPSVIGRDDIVFSTDDLREIGANRRAGSPRHHAMVAAITDYAATLKAAGITFVLAPVPPKPVIYPDSVSPSAKLKNKRYDSYLESLYDELAKAGVIVVDTTKALRADRFDRQGGSFPRAGAVWSPRAASTTATAIHKSVKKTDPARGIERDKSIAAKKISLSQNGESFNTQSVGRLEGDTVTAAAPGKDGAPIVVVGDANAAAYHAAGQSAGLADHLSLAFGAPVEVRSESALGWKDAVRQFSVKKGTPTRIVVWSFSAVEFLREPGKPAAKPVRRPASTGRSPAPAGSGTLPLRDDPGLNVRAE